MSVQNSGPLLTAEGLTKHFAIKGGLLSRTVAKVHAVEDVGFEVAQGETLGVVGESGCGKTTLGRLILRLIEPTKGRVVFDGQEVFKLGPEPLRKLRQDMTMVFQDPYASLDHRMSVSRIVSEPLKIHGLVKNRRQAREKVAEVLERVGLLPDHIDRYPHQFSGGQRQRIAIARTLVLNPKLIIADEPVSALDVSIQAQVLNLLCDLRREFKLTYVFVAHDLRVVEYISDRVAVMYLGHMVELAPVREIYARPLHPYTEALLSAAPSHDPKLRKNRIVLSGDVPSPIDPPPGCPFYQRCSHRSDICKQELPKLKDFGDEHFAACHHPLS